MLSQRLCFLKERCCAMLPLLSVTCFGKSEYLGMHHDDSRSRRHSGSKSSNIRIDKGLHRLD